MKKRFLPVLILVFVLLAALTACGKSAAPAEPEPEAESAFAYMANPWTETDSPDAAAEGAGVGYFSVPEEGFVTSGGAVSWEVFPYMKGLAQANGHVGQMELIVRKGLRQDSEDVSGDYSEYKYEWTQTIDGAEVRCAGNEEGKTVRALWLSDNFSYSLLVRSLDDDSVKVGLDAEATAALVGAIE